MSQKPDRPAQDADDRKATGDKQDGPQDPDETQISDRRAEDLARQPSGGTDPEKPGATMAHLSDSLIGETVTLSSSDRNLIGNFRLKQRLGAGAFGVVYAADDLRLDRRVALKVPFAVRGENVAEYYQRVFREGRAAAALDHPNIVSIYDVAERNGQPFIVSQLIEGPSLYDRLTSGPMDQRDAAEMMMLIARALAYAHNKGIIHRDLKPGNILLDNDGAPHVNDFGIAKHESTDETISSENSIIGTPAYMSPEQAAGQSSSADRRSDVYSLGVILYEMLTGERPFRGSSRMLLHQVIHDEPQRPRQLVQTIDRDLETICLKSMEKERGRRYQDCDELADELARFLSGDAILARPVSQIEYAWRKCRRYPVATSMGLALLVTLCGGLAGVTWQWRNAEANRIREVAARREADHSREELAKEVDYSHRLLYGARMGLAENSVSGGDYRQAKNHLSLAGNRLGKYRDLEFNILRHRVDRYRALLQHIEQVTDVAISDDESMIAACGLRTLLIWDVESGHVIHRAREKGKQLRCVAFAPDSNLVAWSGQSGRIEFTTPGTSGRTRASLDHGGGVGAIAFSQDGSKLLSAGDDGKLVIWSVAAKQAIQTIEAHKGAVNGAEFVDATRIISGGADRRVCLSNVTSGENSVLTVGSDTVTAVAVSGDGKRFAAGLGNTRMLIGDIDDADKSALVVLPDTYAVDLEFLDEPNLLVASLLSGRINVWNLPGVQAARTFKCVKGFGRFAITRDTKRMIVGAGDGSIEEINFTNAILDEINVNSRSLNDARIVDDGKAIVVCPDQGPAQVIHLASGRRLRNIPDFADSSVPESLQDCDLLCVDESLDGNELAFGTSSGQILIWNVADGKLRVLGLNRGRGIMTVRFVGDGSQIVSGGEDGAVRNWDLSRPNESSEITRHGGVIRGLEISPDGKRLVSIAANGSVALMDAETWEEKTRLETGHALQSLAWSHDSQRLAMGDSKGGVLIYAADLSGEPRQLLGHAGPVTCVVFSRSDETLVSGGSDDDVRFWDLVTGQTKMVMTVHDRNIRTLSLSRSGKMLITADAGGLVRTWPAEDPVSP